LEASRNSPQCLHFMAASWISSAQKGQFFIFSSLGKTTEEHSRPHRRWHRPACLPILYRRQDKTADGRIEPARWAFPAPPEHPITYCGHGRPATLVLPGRLRPWPSPW
jgi:hypothetical protein